MSGAGPVPVPLAADARHDLPAMAAAVTDRTRLVLVCSPNNPTGPAVHAEELEAFLDRVPRDVLVVLDEAYVEFVRDEKIPDGLERLAPPPNVAVLRTFSKAYGLAGLRVGYAVAHEPLADAVRAAALPFGVSTIAQEAAIASLAAEAELLERVDTLVAERERVVAGAARRGLVDPGRAGELRLVRPGRADPRLRGRLHGRRGRRPALRRRRRRCTVGEPEANDRLLAVASAFPH